MVAGDLETQLVGTGSTHEVIEVRHLRLPTEAPQAAIRQLACPSVDLGEIGECAFLRFPQHGVGYDIDETRTEQRRRIAPTSAEREKLIAILDRLERCDLLQPFVQRRRGRVTMEHDTGALVESRMECLERTLEYAVALRRESGTGDGSQHHHVALALAAASGPTEVMASCARGFVIEWSEPITAGLAAYSRLPHLFEELLTFGRNCAGSEFAIDGRDRLPARSSPES